MASIGEMWAWLCAASSYAFWGSLLTMALTYLAPIVASFLCAGAPPPPHPAARAPRRGGRGARARGRLSPRCPSFRPGTAPPAAGRVGRWPSVAAGIAALTRAPVLGRSWRRQDLRRKYDAKWAVVTGASSGIGKAIAVRHPAALPPSR